MKSLRDYTIIKRENLFFSLLLNNETLMKSK